MKVKLGELTKIRTGKLDANAASEDGTYPFFTCSKEPLRISTYSYDCECVLVAGNGDLNAKYYNGKFDAYQRTYIIESNGDGRLHLPYLYHFMTRYIQELRKLSIGGVIKYIKLGNLTDAEISLPSIKEQKDACEKLKKVKNIIDKKEAQIYYLDNLIKARFVEMFGVPGANSKGWNEIKLGEVCSLQNGYAFKSSDYINKSGVLNCRMSNIRPDGGFDAEYHPKYLPEEYWDKCSGYRLFDGDVIIAMTDMASDPKILGVPTIVSTNGKKFLLNQRVGKLSFLHDDRMNRVYLMHSLGQKYIRKELAKSAAGSTQINVGKPAILNINIYDPPRSLQDQFATFVAQVDKSKFVLSNELTMCDFYIRLIHNRVMHSRINLRVAQ